MSFWRRFFGEQTELALVALLGGILLVVYAISMIVAPPPIDPDAVH